MRDGRGTLVWLKSWLDLFVGALCSGIGINVRILGRPAKFRLPRERWVIRTGIPLFKNSTSLGELHPPILANLPVGIVVHENKSVSDVRFGAGTGGGRFEGAAENGYGLADLMIVGACLFETYGYSKFLVDSVIRSMVIYLSTLVAGLWVNNAE